MGSNAFPMIIGEGKIGALGQGIGFGYRVLDMHAYVTHHDGLVSFGLGIKAI
jgi:hypothetical protein